MEQVFRYKQEIAALLEQRPDMANYQRNIETILKGATSSHNRMVLLKNMMAQKVFELEEAFKLLRIELEKLRGSKIN